MSEEADIVQVVEPSPAENEARKFGWVPADEFKGEPEAWRDADEFLRRGREINGFLRKDLDKLNSRNATLEAELNEMKSTLTEFSKFHQETEKRAYERALKDLKEAKKEAIADGDGERVLAIEDEIEALKEVKPTEKKVAPQEQPQVDQVFIDWVEQNQWYSKDEDLTVFANGFAEHLRKQNPKLIGKKFLDEVEKKVKDAFPHRFENPNRERPSPVDASTPTRGATGKKSYNDLPAEAKQACDKFVKQGLLTKEQYVKEYFGV